MFRKNRLEWVAKVMNNTEDEFSVSLEAQQLDTRGKILKRTSFSTSLGPKESTEKLIPARSDAANGTLKIKSWKVKRKKQEESQAKEPAQGGVGGAGIAAP
jgi:hypothetical protein